MSAFTHPMRGTCEPGCEMYGVCHCGCGERTRLADKSNARWGIVRDRYVAYRQGHNPNTREAGRRAWGIACSHVGVSVDEIADMVREMIDATSWAATVKLTNTAPGSLSRILHRRYRTVNPRTAERIGKGYAAVFGGERRLSSVPLRAQVQLQLPLYAEHTDWQNPHEGASQMLRLYADRFGLTIRTAWRHYLRLRQPEVPEHIAEMWAAFLKVHPVALWGWEGYFGFPPPPIESEAA